jgi:hypothetical protein
MLQITHIPLSRSAGARAREASKEPTKISSVIRTRESVAAVAAKAHFDSSTGVEMAEPQLALIYEISLNAIGYRVASILLASLSVQRNPLSKCSAIDNTYAEEVPTQLSYLVFWFRGETASWDPHFGPNGGFHFSNGATAQYDPALSLYGGVRVKNVVTALHFSRSISHGGVETRITGTARKPPLP